MAVFKKQVCDLHTACPSKSFHEAIFIFLLKLTCLCLLLLPTFSYSQNMGINTTGASPNASALLDIDASPGNNKGILIPRLSLISSTDGATIANPANSLLVFHNGSIGLPAVGYYYNSGSTISPAWVQLLNGGSTGTAWMLSGNTGTTAGTNFLGTTDIKDLVFKTNNTEWMRILSGGNVGIGTTTPTYHVHIKQINNSHIGSGFAVERSDNGNIGNLFYGGDDNLYLWNHSTNGGFRFSNDNTNGLVQITPAGSVGIGTTNPSPSDGAAKTLQMGNNVILQNTIGTQMNLAQNAYYDGTWKRSVADASEAIRMYNGRINFHLATSGAVGATLPTWDGTDVKMVINDAGNVGIGTSSPANKLEVVGTIKADGYKSSDGSPGVSGTFFTGGVDVTSPSMTHFITWTQAGPPSTSSPTGDFISNNLDDIFGWHCSPCTMPVKCGIDLGSGNAKIVKNLRIDKHGNPPNAFSLEGSNNSTNGTDGTWTILLTDNMTQPSSERVWQEWTISNSTAYRWYRLNVTSQYATGWALYEWELKSDGFTIVVKNGIITSIQ